MRRQVSCVDHHSLLFTVLCVQTHNHTSEDAPVAPSLLSVVQRLVWAIGGGRITLP